jgi:hypothetical protein
MTENIEEYKHYCCTQCGNKIRPHELSQNKNTRCSKIDGTCNWKLVQTSWNKSALGSVVNLGAKGIKYGVNKASEKISEKEYQHSGTSTKAKRIESKLPTGLLKKYLWIGLILFALVGFRILYIRITKTKNFNTENSKINAPVKSSEESSTSQTNQQDTKSNSTSVAASDINTKNFTAQWTGNFGKDQLLINIESIDDQGNVTGYDEVKNNKRILTGSFSNNQFILKEPGDDKWDGVFTITYSEESLKGIWKANNGKLSKEFELRKE